MKLILKKIVNKIFIFSTLIYILLINVSCIKNTTLPKQDINKITLKLSKNLKIKLDKIGKSNTNFNILATVQSQNIILNANTTWIITDSNDQEILKKSSIIQINKNSFEIESENFNLPSEDEDYKIIFIFNGRTSSEDINKTAIYYSKTQEEIDAAISDLKDRANQ